nr:hypothetical protein [Tanacetum cinerariifolium]
DSHLCLLCECKAQNDHSHQNTSLLISAVDFNSMFLQPMRIKGIAKVAIGWFLGCEVGLDYSKVRKTVKSGGTLFTGEKTKQVEGLSAVVVEQLIAQHITKVMVAYEGNESNQNGDGNPIVSVRGVVPTARECTYQDFIKCIYCPINEIQKMETELWNLAVKGNDSTAYIQRFQELILLCTKMVPEEDDRVEKFIRGLPDNIQGNKLKGYATRNAENQMRVDNNPKNNFVQQPPLKRQDVAKTYMVVNNNNKGYAGILPLYNKCKPYHHDLCPVKCGNCKKVGHQASDCWTPTMMTCYGCGGKGHTKRYCPELGNQNGDKKLVRSSILLWVRPSPNIRYISVLTNANAIRNFIFAIISRLSDVT